MITTVAWCKSRSRMVTAVVCSGRKRGPLLERPVRADGQRSAFVGAGDEPE